MLGGWAYGAIYRDQPPSETPPFRRAGSTSTIAADHTAPSATKPPLARLTELNNLLGS